MRLKKWVGGNDRQNAEPFIFQLLLNRTDKNPKLAHMRIPSLQNQLDASLEQICSAADFLPRTFLVR
jgi:hypothetical protein